MSKENPTVMEEIANRAMMPNDVIKLALEMRDFQNNSNLWTTDQRLHEILTVFCDELKNAEGNKATTIMQEIEKRVLMPPYDVVILAIHIRPYQTQNNQRLCEILSFLCEELKKRRTHEVGVPFGCMSNASDGMY